MQKVKQQQQRLEELKRAQANVNNNTQKDSRTNEYVK